MHELMHRRQLYWAGTFLFIFSVLLSLSPAGRERSWSVDYRISHWLAFLTWLILATIAHRIISRNLSDRDPYLLPLALLLSGWGLLTIWRLQPGFGFRQLIWFVTSSLIFLVGLNSQFDLSHLRRYKYLLLTGGLLFTSLTLIFGSNPMGAGPRLWLGFSGFYLQPSEPLKLLLVIYLSAYFADKYPLTLNSIPLLAPTLVLTGGALVLLLAQRDLGTALIFIYIFTIILFVVTGSKRVLFIALFSIVFALGLGYAFIDIVHTRLDSWINPWSDPTGNSYQIIQSLLAIANGGIAGRGPGMGNPTLVPVALSDFIFSAIAEETGLAGIIGLLLVYWLFLTRGIIIALKATDRFRRYLAMGIVAYLSGQSFLIIGGNLRLLPLTGVTLPFVSYGGSSLLTSFIALLLLIKISATDEEEPAPLSALQPFTLLGGLLAFSIIICALGSGWWVIIRGPVLLARTDNARRAISDRFVPRGQILDRNNKPIDINGGESGSYTRSYLYPDLAPVVGYNHPIFGQAGIESSMDPYLRGLQGNPASLIWWDHLLYGTPPPGLDVRLSLDLELQSNADELIDDYVGGLILMNTDTGEILAMASHPTFDPNKLDETGDDLTRDANSPLINRTTQGFYPIGKLLDPIIRERYGKMIIGEGEWDNFYNELSLDHQPDPILPTFSTQSNQGLRKTKFTPLQVAVILAGLSNHGYMTTPQIVLGVNSPTQGWIVFSHNDESKQILSQETADEIASSYIRPGNSYWSIDEEIISNDSTTTWFVAGTSPDWAGTSLVMVVVLENNNHIRAEYITDKIMSGILNK